ncbi:hypothetical protein FE782_19880 [Paenibacillus antri]|uniref:SHOCT domain-containing protein n=1 Tax=Paenibacillus antri TaxID=2582848 RepID=A0A5R9GD92_9BACL|nr:hypothetical protein [Paenibacillus antri]TLS50623.1 hypothetical protein FE782_19880 [Paenibacillus antri]
MNRMKMMTASALAFSLAIGGIAFANLQAEAAALPDDSAAAASVAESTSATGDRAFRGGARGFFGLDAIQDDLATYLSLDAATLREKLQTQTLAAIAEAQGISRADLTAKLTALIESAIAEADADSPLQALDAAKAAEQLLDRTDAFFGGKEGHRGGGGKGWMSSVTSELQSLLGLTESELQAALREGKTLADIAGEQGVDVQAVIDLQAKRMTEKLDGALAAGTITQDQYDARKAEIVDRATDMVNNGWSRGDRGPDGHGGRGFGGGMKQGATAPSDAAAPTTSTADVSA